MDWWERVEHLPKNVRNFGKMESNQRHISFRMKKRGMHWSTEGGEAMVKVKQGILNIILREVYLKHQHRSVRKQREGKKAIKLAQILREKARPSIGLKNNTIRLSAAIGQLVKSFR